MTTLLEDAPALLISMLLLIAITVLIALGSLPVSNPLVTAIFVGVMSFWIGSGASRATARQLTVSLPSHLPSPIEPDKETTV